MGPYQGLGARESAVVELLWKALAARMGSPRQSRQSWSVLLMFLPMLIMSIFFLLSSGTDVEASIASMPLSESDVEISVDDSLSVFLLLIVLLTL